MSERGELVSPAAAARALRISERTLRRLAARGELTTIPHGREVRYDAAEVARLAAKHPASAVRMDSGHDPGQDSGQDGQGEMARTATPDSTTATTAATAATAATRDDAPYMRETGPEGGTPATASTGATGATEGGPEGGTAAGTAGEVAALTLAIESLRESLRAADSERRRLTDELSHAQREAGLWEGRARTLDERLRQVEKLALSSGQDMPHNPEAGQDGQHGGQWTAKDSRDSKHMRGLPVRVAAFVRRFRRI